MLSYLSLGDFSESSFSIKWETSPECSRFACFVAQTCRRTQRSNNQAVTAQVAIIPAIGTAPLPS
jgi:hypothetical protein